MVQCSRTARLHDALIIPKLTEAEDYSLLKSIRARRVMTNVEFLYRTGCSPERAKELLLDEAFLHAFVDEQHPVQKTITVDRGAQESTMAWTIRLDGDLPALVTRFVGRTAELHLVIDLRAATLHMSAKAKRTGTMTCELRIDGDGAAGSVLNVKGELCVSGAFGGMAETTVRDQIITPVFREDLVRLLDERCQEQGGKDNGVTEQLP